MIDDGSSDETCRIASQFTKVIRFEKNQGISAALRAGLCYARENNYDFCVQIDGDGQHIPTEIAHLVTEYNRFPAPLVIGSRYYGHVLPLSGGMRRIAGLIISIQIFLLFDRHWLYDATSGMRMMDRKAIAYFCENLDIKSPDSVIAAQAISAGLSFKEVPVKMRLRTVGASYITGFKGVIFLFRVIRKIIMIRIKQ